LRLPHLCLGGLRLRATKPRYSILLPVTWQLDTLQRQLPHWFSMFQCFNVHILVKLGAFLYLSNGVVNIDKGDKLKWKKLINPQRKLNSRLLFTVVGSQSKIFKTFWEPNVKPSLNKKQNSIYMLEYFLQRCRKDRTKWFLQRVDLLHIKLKLRDLNYQTPFFADCILNTKKIATKFNFQLITLEILKQSERSIF
jgi:hypothetical protein